MSIIKLWTKKDNEKLFDLIKKSRIFCNFKGFIDEFEYLQKYSNGIKDSFLYYTLGAFSENFREIRHKLLIKGKLKEEDKELLSKLTINLINFTGKILNINMEEVNGPKNEIK